MSVTLKRLNHLPLGRKSFIRFCGASIGFSLIELLIVMAIVGMLLALSAPALLEMGPSRKAAAMELTGFLDRARTQAVTKSERTYVAFADQSHPDESLRFRSYSFFVENPEDDSESSLLDRELIQTSEWMTLPEGIFFGSANLFKIDPSNTFRTLHDLPTTRSFRISASKSAAFPFLVFDASGKVVYPSLIEADGLNLAVVEGALDSGGNKIMPMGANNETPRAELIRIAFYTGRATILTD
ncbi:MAG: prepilin-type N-terminal cleavage/methylation domain-containing protein [Verrucomicrobiales bacterium]|nr:prepilin-type N-terminal cleavage/methylation domain-containing protein [Verrucomicrobiales bacterium]